MARKGLIEGLPENIPDLQELCPICLFTKATKIPRGPTTDISTFSPCFILQMDFSFFNVESIHVFPSIFVDICSATSCPFGFSSRSKIPPIYILKFLVTKLRIQNKKFALVRVDEYGALSVFY